MEGGAFPTRLAKWGVGLGALHLVLLAVVPVLLRTGVVDVHAPWLLPLGVLLPVAVAALWLAVGERARFARDRLWPALPALLVLSVASGALGTAVAFSTETPFLGDGEHDPALLLSQRLYGWGTFLAAAGASVAVLLAVRARGEPDRVLVGGLLLYPLMMPLLALPLFHGFLDPLRDDFTPMGVFLAETRFREILPPLLFVLVALHALALSRAQPSAVRWARSLMLVTLGIAAWYIGNVLLSGYYRVDVMDVDANHVLGTVAFLTQAGAMLAIAVGLVVEAEEGEGVRQPSPASETS